MKTLIKVHILYSLLKYDHHVFYQTTIQSQITGTAFSRKYFLFAQSPKNHHLAFKWSHFQFCSEWNQLTEKRSMFKGEYKKIVFKYVVHF